MSDLAKDAISILDGYGIQQAHFIGNSMGGWICQRIAIDHPQRVSSLVIISAGPIEITDEWTIPLTIEEQETLLNTSKMFSLRKEEKNLDENIQTFLPIWRYLNAEIPLDEEMAMQFTRDLLVRAKNKNAKGNHERMMSEFLSTMKRENTLQKIMQPTLIIQGDKDPIVLPRHGKSVASAIPNSRLVVIEGMGHTIFNRDLQEKIAKLVVGHIKNKN
jgi:pimeloyl-ACP methyl ester carboxylesterase